ncbi:MAG: DUF2911 domain-containing protein [Spirosomataceae bacterium]
MKNTVFALFFSLIVLNFACSQNPPASPHTTTEGKDVSITYGQPSKKGRVIFGAEGSQSLEKYGKVWRTGADEATVIEFKKDGMFGGKAIKAGKYSLFTIPGEKEWTVILNSEAKQWGAYNYKQDKDVLRVTVPATVNKEPVEKLNFKVEDTALVFAWDTAGFSVPLKF